MKYLGLVLTLFLVSCGSERYEQTEPRDLSNKYVVICIDGHQYYQRRAGHKGMTAIKLDSEGKPVKCK